MLSPHFCYMTKIRETTRSFTPKTSKYFRVFPESFLNHPILPSFTDRPRPYLPLDHVIRRSTMTSKANILLVGSGGVGTMAAYNLEVGGLVSVTAVMRSNFEAVMQDGFTITSLDHGYVKGWKPSSSL
jgi:hypothetical protein